MERYPLSDTNLYIRNFGKGRSRITIIEPENVTNYDPIRISGCSVILFNDTVISELNKFYHHVASRPKRNKVFPGGIGSTADQGLKKYLQLNGRFRDNDE